ncbi:hypothetical protein T06_850 [Trichinella sp. T6]|nr:hypothetical protein T06_850 [Trichinella sp. T6]
MARVAVDVGSLVEDDISDAAFLPPDDALRSVAHILLCQRTAASVYRLTTCYEGRKSPCGEMRNSPSITGYRIQQIQQHGRIQFVK